jgi:osmotically-inducible protein OsmY
VDASNIEVQVTNCEVTLKGVASTRQEKRRAEHIVEDISGVRDVHNEIRVSREGERRGATELDLTGH